MEVSIGVSGDTMTAKELYEIALRFAPDIIPQRYENLSDKLDAQLRISEHFRRLAETALLIEQSNFNPVISAYAPVKMSQAEQSVWNEHFCSPLHLVKNVPGCPYCVGEPYQPTADRNRIRNHGEEDWNSPYRTGWCMVWKGKTVRWRFSETVDQETQDEIGTVIDAACKPTETTQPNAFGGDDTPLGDTNTPALITAVSEWLKSHGWEMTGHGGNTMLWNHKMLGPGSPTLLTIDAAFLMQLRRTYDLGFEAGKLHPKETTDDNAQHVAQGWNKWPEVTPKSQGYVLISDGEKWAVANVSITESGTALWVSNYYHDLYNGELGEAKYWRNLPSFPKEAIS